MTAPKAPTKHSNLANKQDPHALDGSIKELEHLINKTQAEQQTPDDNIPVLDDIVTPEDIDRQQFDHHSSQELEQNYGINLQPKGHITSLQLTSLVNNIEGKITDELDALLEILKDTLKDSIVDELKTQLKEEIEHPKRRKHD